MDTTTYPSPAATELAALRPKAEAAGEWHPGWLLPSKTITVFVLDSMLRHTRHRVTDHHSGVKNTVTFDDDER